MKIILLTVVVALLIQASLQVQIEDSVDKKIEEIYQQDLEIDYFEYDQDQEIGSIAKKIKAAKCVKLAGEQVNDLLELYHDIVHFKIIGGFKKIWPILVKIKPILTTCDVFFCIDPSIQKCEEEEQTTCSQYRLRAYPDCKNGYTNHGCCKCWPSCPDGWKSFGRMCIKPKNYWRGTGYALWDKKKCEKQHSQGCEQDGLLIYPKCDQGYHSHLFTWCSADCPSGFDHLGHTCLRPFNHYKRGRGYPMTVGLSCLNAKKIDENADCNQVIEEFLILQDQFDKVYVQFTDTQLDEEDRFLLITTEFFILMDELAARYTFIQEHQCLSSDLLEIM